MKYFCRQEEEKEKHSVVLQCTICTQCLKITPNCLILNLSPLFIESKSGIKKMTFHLVNETFSSDFQPLCSMLMAYYLWPLAMQMISLGSGASFVHEE